MNLRNEARLGGREGDLRVGKTEVCQISKDSEISFEEKSM